MARRVVRDAYADAAKAFLGGMRAADPEAFSEKRFAKGLEVNPNAEWVYTEVNTKQERDALLSQGWEIVQTEEKSFRGRQRPSSFLLRKRNPR